MNTPTQSSYRFVIQGLVFAIQMCLGLNFAAPAPMLPLIMRDLNIESTTASLLMSSTPLMIAVFMVPASFMAPRLGLKLSYGLGALCMAAGLFVPLASDFAALLVLRLVYGFGVAIVLPQTASVIMQWFTPRQVPSVNGFNIVGQSLGNTLAMFLGGSLAQTLGWSATLMLTGAVSLASAIAWLVLGRSSVRLEAVAAPPSLGEMAGVLRDRSTLLLGIGLAGAFGQNVALSSWLPTYYNKVLAFPLESAGSMVSLIPLFGILGAFLGGYLPVRLGLRRPILILSGGLMTLLAFGTFVLPNEALIFTSVVSIGVMSWAFVPASFTVPMELPGVTAATAGMSLAVALSLGNIGGFFAPVMVGFLADQTGSYVPGLAIAALIPLSLLTCGYLLPETGPRSARLRLEASSCEN